MKNKKRILLYSGTIVIILLLIGIILLCRVQRFEKAKQDAILFGNMAMATYIKNHDYNEELASQYSLKDVDILNIINTCPITNKKYDKNKSNSNISFRDKNDFDMVLKIVGNLVCGKYTIQYEYQSDFSDPENDETNAYNVSVIINK